MLAQISKINLVKNKMTILFIYNVKWKNIWRLKHQAAKGSYFWGRRGIIVMG